MLGEDVANKLLNEGWKPTAIEAKACGLVEEVIQHESLLVKAQVRTSVYRWVIGFLTGIGRDSFIDSLLLGRIGKLVQYKKLVQYTFQVDHKLLK